MNQNGRRITCVMPSRREDDRARRNWLQVMYEVEHTPTLMGILIDRTNSGGIQSYLELHGWKRDYSSLRIVRQSGNAPLRDVWRCISLTHPNWLVTLADDDRWEGLSSLSPDQDPGISLVSPRLVITSSTSSEPVPSSALLPQHALHGALHRDVVQTIASYLASAPTPWGGEDLLLLFVAESMGSVVQSSDYTYFWSSRNWEPATQEAALMGYLFEAGWDHLASLSTYLLCQSLDRVAVTARSRPYLGTHEWRLMVNRAMSQFWPVTSPRNHAAFKRLPPFVRSSILASRGLSGRQRLMSTAAGSLRNLLSLRRPRSQLERFTSGRVLISDVTAIRDLLLPVLRAEAPPATYPQIDYWSECLSEVLGHFADAPKV